ncbi:hypothetical protein F5Y19DRAFT_476909 [Xylariaceae sp. FL1651]|nr:hypothetical protein F5Y19DRAFT_476909 [Xylariaceae sp. FL1651]
MKQWTTLMGGIDNLKLEITPDLVELKDDEAVADCNVFIGLKTRESKEARRRPVINCKTTPSWDKEVLRLTNGRWADIIVETGGPGTMNKSLSCVAHGGTISAVGILTVLMEKGAGRARVAVGMHLVQRNASPTGINIGLHDRVEEMIRLVYESSVRPVIDHVFGFTDVKAALEHLQMGSHFGKVVIRVNDE